LLGPICLKLKNARQSSGVGAVLQICKTGKNLLLNQQHLLQLYLTVEFQF
jgi:hypothetical protein